MQMDIDKQMHDKLSEIQNQFDEHVRTVNEHYDKEFERVNGIIREAKEKHGWETNACNQLDNQLRELGSTIESKRANQKEEVRNIFEKNKQVLEESKKEADEIVSTKKKKN